MPTITNINLKADILTARMPLSDAFNRARGAGERMGVHHGLSLSYVGSGWPTGNYSTQYLRILAGKAVIAADKTAVVAAEAEVMLTAILSADWTIDLAALGIDTTDQDYWVVLKVVYVAPTVNEDTGLVANIGTNEPEIDFVPVSSGAGFSGQYGFVLGKINRAQKYVETIGDQAFNNSDVNLENVWGSLPNIMTESTALGAAIKGQCLKNLSNLKKHIRVENVSDTAAAESLATTTMPLNGITAAVATNLTMINGWSRPIDWLNSYTALYFTAGIYKDVEKFEIYNCHFKNDMQFAFHRTPGHAKVNEWIITGNQSKLLDATQIQLLADYGSRQFIFDCKGSVFEGDLTLDLVLDFVGMPYLNLYKIQIKNLQVQGNLVINYGQSWLGVAGGALATIEYDNVQVMGATNVLRPWPCVKGVLQGGAITNALYAPAYPTAYGFNTAGYFLNSAQETVFTGYTEAPGPALLHYWRRAAGLPAASIYTRGVLIPTYLHSKVAGSGSMAMDDPWLREGADAGIVIKNSTVPSSLLPDPITAADAIIPTGAGDAAHMIRVRLQNCKYIGGSGADGFGYFSRLTFRLTGDLIYTLAEYTALDWHDVITKRDLRVSTDLEVVGATQLNGTLQVDDQVHADLSVSADEFVHADLDVSAGVDVEAGEDVNAGVDVNAVRDATAGRDVDATRDVVAHRYVKTNSIRFGLTAMNPSEIIELPLTMPVVFETKHVFKAFFGIGASPAPVANIPYKLFDIDSRVSFMVKAYFERSTANYYYLYGALPGDQWWSKQVSYIRFTGWASGAMHGGCGIVEDVAALPAENLLYFDRFNGEVGFKMAVMPVDFMMYIEVDRLFHL